MVEMGRSLSKGDAERDRIASCAYLQWAADAGHVVGRFYLCRGIGCAVDLAGAAGLMLAMADTGNKTANEVYA